MDEGMMNPRHCQRKFTGAPVTLSMDQESLLNRHPRGTKNSVGGVLINALEGLKTQTLVCSVDRSVWTDF